MRSSTRAEERPRRSLRCALHMHRYTLQRSADGSTPYKECVRCGKYRHRSHFTVDIHHASTAGGGAAKTSRHEFGANEYYEHYRR